MDEESAGQKWKDAFVFFSRRRRRRPKLARSFGTSHNEIAATKGAKSTRAKPRTFSLVVPFFRLGLRLLEFNPAKRECCPGRLPLKEGRRYQPEPRARRCARGVDIQAAAEGHPRTPCRSGLIVKCRADMRDAEQACATGSRRGAPVVTRAATNHNAGHSPKRFA